MISEKKVLTRDQASEIIRRASSDDSVLVGGQAVVFWCEHFGIAQPLPVLTRDIDFYGGKEAIVAAADRLKVFNARVYMASLDDATPNSGKIAFDLPGLEAGEIDFLYLIKGLGSMEVLEKAVPIVIDGIEINMIHPVLLLESKLTNVATIVRKRDPEGLAQAALAIDVVKHFIGSSIGMVEPRATLNILKRVLRYADTDEAKYCWYHHGIDSLDAVPLDVLQTSPEAVIQRFVSEGLPVERQRIEEHRARYQSIVDRQKAYEAGRHASAPQPTKTSVRRPAPADDDPSPY